MSGGDPLLARVADAGRRRSEADSSKREASEELNALVLEALKAGAGVSEVARASGLSRQAIYNLRDA